MGGVILVTLGVLFLLDNYNILDFDKGIPVLLIVIGLLLAAARTGSMEGHVQLSSMGGIPSANPSGSNPPDDRQVKL